MRHLLQIAGLVTLASVSAGAQTVIDGTLGTVNGQVIMQSDVRQARALKLVRIGDGSDAAILTELENRILVLAQIGRSAQPDPTADEVRARRLEWEASLGSGASPAAQLARSGMEDADLAAWLRGDVRIQKYLQQLFSRQADPPAAISKWILDLRKRAGLK
jgi:hypothetical protein